MEQKRMNDILQGVLVNSTQLAFVEEAYGTLALLENANDVFRYFINNITSVTLSNELDIFRKYLAVIKVSYGDRFSVRLADEDGYSSVYILRLSVISFFDSILALYLEQGEVSVDFNISFEVNGNNNQMIIAVQTGRVENCHKLDLE